MKSLPDAVVSCCPGEPGAVLDPSVCCLPISLANGGAQWGLQQGEGVKTVWGGQTHPVLQPGFAGCCYAELSSAAGAGVHQETGAFLPSTHLPHRSHSPVHPGRGDDCFLPAPGDVSSLALEDFSVTWREWHCVGTHPPGSGET